MRRIVLCLLVSTLYFCANAQMPDSSYLAFDFPIADTTFETPPDPIIFTTLIAESAFNQGHIANPLKLAQAKAASLLIARTGNDPNGRFDFRLRGIKSFDITEPLIVIDGMPAASLEGLHPNDIASIEILKDGADLAFYGIRGSNGVLSVRTKRGEVGKLRLAYSTYRASEKLAKKPDLMSAAGFRSIDGRDYGATTDWWEEVSRRALSHRHAISLSGGADNSNYYASLNYDDVNGIALGSAFQRFNGRLSFEQKALNNKLFLSGGIASATRKSNLTPLMAFWQATSFNPTAPVYGEGEEFEEYGGYFEPLIYLAYNPVSLLKQNEFVEEYQNLMLQLNAKIQLTANLSGSVQYGNQEENLGNSAFFSSASLYGGHWRRGLAQRSESSKSNRYFSTRLNFSKAWETFQMNAALNYRRQNILTQSLGAEGGDFLTDFFSYNNLSAASDFDNGDGSLTSYKEQHMLSGLNGRLDMVFADQYYLSATLSRDGSSRLGANKKWGLFYGLNAGVRVNDWLKIRTAYSKTGNLPSRGFLSQEIHQEAYPYYFYNGEFNLFYLLTQEANPDLQWEETKEWSLGVDFSLWNNRLYGSVDFYTSRSDELIMPIWVESPPHLGYQRYSNVGALKNAGLEFYANYQLIKKQDFSWQIGLTGARYAKTKLLDYIYGRWDEGETYVGILGGSCDFPVIRLKKGEPLGEIYGYRLHPTRKVSPDGQWNRIDQNGDGYYSREDYVLVGNALPKASLGIANQVQWRRFKADFMFRGVFGHDLINHIKSFHSAPAVASAYNVLKVAKTNFRDLDEWPDFTDNDVEKASFLRLDYLTFSYDFKIKSFESLSLYITAQNLFTITSYTGLDPEVRLEDRDFSGYLDYNLTSDPYSDSGDPLVPGMDRRNTYPPSRTFLIGLKLGL